MRANDVPPHVFPRLNFKLGSLIRGRAEELHDAKACHTQSERMLLISAPHATPALETHPNSLFRLPVFSLPKSTSSWY